MKAKFVYLLFFWMIFGLNLCWSQSNSFNSVGEKSGIWIEKDGNNNATGDYRNGLKQGQWIVSNDSCIIRLHTYDKDTLNGKTIIFRDNCTLKYVISYKSGLIHGKVSFYSKNEELIAVYTYENGIRTTLDFVLLDEETPSLEHTFTPEW